MENKDIMHKVIGVKLKLNNAFSRMFGASALSTLAGIGLAKANENLQFLPIMGGTFLTVTSLISLEKYLKSYIRVASHCFALESIAKSASNLLSSLGNGISYEIKLKKDFYSNDLKFCLIKKSDYSIFPGIIESSNYRDLFVKQVGMSEEEADGLVLYLNKMLDYKFSKINNAEKRKRNIYGKLNIPSITIDNLDDAFLVDGGFRFAISPIDDRCLEYLPCKPALNSIEKKRLVKQIRSLSIEEQTDIVCNILNNKYQNGADVEKAVLARKI